MRTLDQNDLGLESALRPLQSHVKAAGDANLEQALRRVELQVNPVLLARAAVACSAPGPATVSRIWPRADATLTPRRRPIDPILADPNEAYRTEVTPGAHGCPAGPQQLARPRASRMADDRRRVATTSAPGSPRPITTRGRSSSGCKGSDLAAFLARQITRDEALKRIEVRVF